MVFRNPKVGIFFIKTNTVSRICIFFCAEGLVYAVFLIVK